jgi:hypothetical protein
MGETWGSGARRLDAWAMAKSWSPWRTYGYEIKVSRSDFLNDLKWDHYLPVCHEFYIAVPAKLVVPEELPANVGLLWQIGGDRLICKRRAVRRDPEPESLIRLMSYVLMSRTRVVANMHEANLGAEDKRAFWARWLEQDTGEQWLGRMVSHRLAERVERAEQRCRRAEQTVASYERLRERIRSWGLDPDHATEYELDHRFKPDSQRDLRLRRAAAAIERGAREIQDALKVEGVA